LPFVFILSPRSPKKPRSKHPLLLNSTAVQSLSQTHGPSASQVSAPHTPSRKVVEGTRESPIALLDDETETKPSLKRSAPPSASGEASNITSESAPSKKKRKITDAQPLSAELEASIEVLKEQIAKENFEVKGKFPPALKPPLQQLAKQAIIQGEYNDAFFLRMPQIFPYNKFTMTVGGISSNNHKQNFIVNVWV